MDYASALMESGEKEPDGLGNEFWLAPNLPFALRGRIETVFEVLGHLPLEQPLAVVADAGKTVAANAPLLRLLGADPSIVGQMWSRVMPAWPDRARTFRRDGEQVFEEHLNGSGGDSVWVRVSLGPLAERGEERAMAYVLFISRPDVETVDHEEVRRLRKSLQLLADTQTDYVVEIDRDALMTFVSPSFCRALGASEQELIGKPFAGRVTAADQAGVAAAISEAQQPPFTAGMQARLAAVPSAPVAWQLDAVIGDGIVGLDLVGRPGKSGEGGARGACRRIAGRSRTVRPATRADRAGPRGAPAGWIRPTVCACPRRRRGRRGGVRLRLGPSRRRRGDGARLASSDRLRSRGPLTRAFWRRDRRSARRAVRHVLWSAGTGRDTGRGATTSRTEPFTRRSAAIGRNPFHERVVLPTVPRYRVRHRRRCRRACAMPRPRRRRVGAGGAGQGRMDRPRPDGPAGAAAWRPRLLRAQTSAIANLALANGEKAYTICFIECPGGVPAVLRASPPRQARRPARASHVKEKERHEGSCCRYRRRRSVLDRRDRQASRPQG